MRITNLFGSTPAANMVKSYSFKSDLNDDYSNVSRKMKHAYHISEPIIRRFFFPKTCATSFTSGALSLIHSALERNAAILRKVLAHFLFNHVTDSCSLFISFLIFPFFLDFITIIVVGFLIKQLFYSGLLDISALLRASLVIYHSISSAPS